MAEEKENQKLRIDNTELVFAIQRVKNEHTDENFNRVAHLVQTAKFACPAEVVEKTEAVEKDDGKVALENKKSFRFHVLANSDGKKYLAVFTSPGEIEKGESKFSSSNYVIMDVVALLSAFTKEDSDLEGVVIDPFSNNFVVPKGIIRNLAETEYFNPKPNEQVKISVPPRFPEGFIDAVRNSLDEDARVKQLFVMILERQNGAKSLLFVMEPEEESVEGIRDIFRCIADVVAPYTRGMHLMFVPYSESFAKNAVANKLPCYRK